MLVLANDLLVVGRPSRRNVKSKSKRQSKAGLPKEIKFIQSAPLSAVTASASDTSTEFRVVTTRAAYTFVCRSVGERNRWVESIVQTIAAYCRLRSSLHARPLTRSSGTRAHRVRVRAMCDLCETAG